MKNQPPGLFRKILILSLFVIGISFSSISFAQKEAGFLSTFSSFLKTSFFSGTDKHRWNIVFGLPSDGIFSQRTKKSASKVTNRTANKRSVSLTPRGEGEEVTSSRIRSRVQTDSVRRIVSDSINTACTDSDKGVNKFKKGWVDLKMGGKTERFWDKNMGKGVLEFSCNEHGIQGEYIACKNAPNGGACEPETVSQECPIPSCVAPKQGCRYESGFFPNGCVNPCAELVCDGGVSICPKVVCAEPKPGCYYKNKITTNGCPTCGTLICEDEIVDVTPRISYWWGKVNQHNEKGVWKTDLDGVSGANLNKLTYCKKFWPNTKSVKKYKSEKISTWRDGGNRGGSYVSTRTSYECVSVPEENCIEKNNECCMGDKCLHTDISCQPGTTYNFHGCSDDCHPIETCEGGSIGDISILASGSNSYLGVGDNFVEIGAFFLSTNEAVKIKSIYFENTGSAIIDDEYLKNLGLYSSENNIISNQKVSVSGNLVKFNTEGFSLSGSKEISVRADIIAGKGFESFIKFKVTKLLLSDGTVVEFSSNNILKKYTIKRGSIVLGTEGTPGKENISTEVTQRTLLKGRLTIGEPVLLKELRVQYTVTGLANAMDFDGSIFDNYQLYINGERVNISSTPSTQPQQIVMNFSPQFIGGDVLLEINADIVPTDSPASVMFMIDPVGVIASYARGGKEVVTNDYMSGIIKGTTFSFENTTITEGKLVADIGATVYSKVLIAGQNDIEVMQVRFNAINDEVQIKDLYFENDLDNNESSDNIDISERLDFKLYNEEGQLLQTKAMVNGALHFELANSNRIIVPQNSSSFVTVKVDVRDILDENQTGKRLRLSLDGSHTTKGIEAVSSSTGANITPPTSGWEVSPGNVVSEEMIVYKTIFVLDHWSIQPNFIDPSIAMQEVYKFYGLASSYGAIDLGKVSLNLALTGMRSANNIISSQDVDIRLVRSDGTIDNTTYVGEATVQSGTATTAEIHINFNQQYFAAGERRVYAILLGNLEDDPQSAPDDDALSFSFNSDFSYTVPTSKNNQQGNIVWSDRASTAHSDRSADWENGYLTSVETTTKIITD